MPMPRFFRGGTASAAALNAIAEEVDLQGLACKVRTTATSVLAPNTDYYITWHVEDYDTYGGGMWAAPANHYVQIRANGTYLLKAQLRFPVFTSGECAGKILVNTTNVFSTDPVNGPRTSDKRPFSTSGEGVTLGMSTVEQLYAGDRIYTNVWHSSAGSVTALRQDYGGSYLSVSRLSALI
jgi:hypothetical protein